MAATGAVVPVVFVQPSVPAFVHKITTPRGRVRIRGTGVIQSAHRLYLVGTEKVRLKRSETAGVVARGVIQAVVKSATGGLAGCSVILGAVE